ncbi:MAG: STAS/SEC14 domain-containing protein [Burkholderiales bacterium]|nr:STAS/SEC14 domain-containing protein [Burkholderiales bacterium]
MITIEQNEQRLHATVFGEFTLADFREFEDAVMYRLEFDGQVNLLLDLSEMGRYTIDTLWEDIKFGKEHPYAFERIAVVTQSEWVGSLAWLSNMFAEAKVGVFHDAGEAEEWLAS